MTNSKRRVPAVRGRYERRRARYRFVVELWESAEAHSASLQLESVRAAIAEAMPLLSGKMGGFRFQVAGSPFHR